MFGNQENTLWVEKFRPGTLEGYVGNEHIIEKVKIYLKSGDVPHLLFYGNAGTGKTTLAKALCNDCFKMESFLEMEVSNPSNAVLDKLEKNKSLTKSVTQMTNELTERGIQDVASASLFELEGLYHAIIDKEELDMMRKLAKRVPFPLHPTGT